MTTLSQLLPITRASEMLQILRVILDNQTWKVALTDIRFLILSDAGDNHQRVNNCLERSRNNYGRYIHFLI
jgi:hypothetical protein